MVVKRRALGKGLEALIPSDISDRSGYTTISVSEIEPNPYQPRERFSNEGIKELSDSIASKGLIQPIVVRKHNGKFQVVVGERRLRAVKILGWKYVDVVVVDVEDKDLLQMALIENLQREDINPVEMARAYRRLSEEFGMKQEEIAEVVGKNRATVANVMRILKLPDEVQELIEEGRIGLSQAKELLTIDDKRIIVEIAREVAEKGLTVENIIEKRKRLNRGRREKSRVSEIDPEIEALTDEMSRRLQTKVKIRYMKGRGKIIIDFYSDDEFSKIIRLIRGY
ncbi:MAG TPA: ParB/RepB/Spo0J family partition protein [Firmicutes bacterium]|nr:MAG: chromosome partitioning protein ParB [Candidatus Coatesbacteria bacterium]RLC43326.1 MAG: chromosome partitioning protein ParB [Candidatus Coatesbacteria bacterium]HDM43483.1 ParB/RepB/Spo0J family partition protein [Bacillota bacterium]